MTHLSEQILKILIDNNIKREDISQTLDSIKQDIELGLWIKVELSSTIFFKLKDTIFYNFEYCNYNNEKVGKTTIKDYGKNYPTLMFNSFGDNYFYDDTLKKLHKELLDIKNKWNQDIMMAELYSQNEFEWVVNEEESSKLIIYDKETETPMKYGYYNNYYSNIYGTNGKPIKFDNNIILCSIYKMDLYREFNSLTNVLNELINNISLAIEQHKGIFTHFDN